MNNPIQHPPPVLASSAGVVAGQLRPVRFRKRHIVALAAVVILAWCYIGVTGYFRLSSETRALRESVMNSVSGQWSKRFAVNVGRCTVGLVQLGSGLVHLPPEARAALDSLRGGEVGVYRLQQAQGCINPAAVFQAADRAMAARGWDRIVGVAKASELVGIYAPRSGSGLKCCLMVLHEQDLVVASVRGDPRPLLKLATRRLDGCRGLRGAAAQEQSAQPKAQQRDRTRFGHDRERDEAGQAVRFPAGIPRRGLF
jgi:hypothetical protein